MKINTYILRGILIIGLLNLCACEEFVEVAPPNNKLVSEEVFNSDATARSAMTGIYNQLFLAEFSNGSRSSITVLSGLSADNIQNINPNVLTRMQFENNDLLADNESNLAIWSSAYSIIYMTNAMLEGLGNSSNVSAELSDQLEGEARFIRAFTYFYLVNLYGDLPLILSTNYKENQLASRMSKNDIYLQIVNDLEVAMALLPSEYTTGERTQVNKYAAIALSARVHLFLKDWEKAIDLSAMVIDASSTYELLNNINDVFLANSREAIWQISPIGGGGGLTQTNEGSLFIIHPVFSFLASIKLRPSFATTFEGEDLRFQNWIGYHEGEDAFFAYKYKIWNSSEFPIEEYSMVLRFAEQYLIRAEAYAQTGNLAEAIKDIAIIQQRAGLSPVSETKPNISQEELLNLIMEERRKELFAEWGHRWFDLKRTDNAGGKLSDIKPLWETTDFLYPIPSEERRKNPNLSQNEGY